jgi:TatA/E family protein of Tat protein translocase
MNLGAFEVLIVLGVLLVLFGASFLTRVSRNLGRSVGAYRHGLKDGDRVDEAEARIERVPDDEVPGAEDDARPPRGIPPCD